MKKFRLLALALTLVMCFGILTACGGTTATTAGTTAGTSGSVAAGVIKIGGIGPLTGAAATYGTSVANGAKNRRR